MNRLARFAGFGRHHEDDGADAPHGVHPPRTDVQVERMDPEELREPIIDALRKVYDPEIPVNVADLGLIYSLEVEGAAGAGAGDDDGGVRVRILMTLTAPGCGMGPVIANDVKERVEALPDVTAADVEVVFDPPWSQNMMSDAAKLELGLL